MTERKFWQDKAAVLMLVVAHAVALFVIAPFAPQNGGDALFILIGLTSSQASVLSIWAMFGKQSVPLRLAVFLLAVPAIAIGAIRLTHFSAPGETQVVSVMLGFFMGFQAVCVLTLFGLLQIIACVFRSRSATPATTRAAHNSQFATRGLFAFMAAVSVLLAVGRTVLPHTGWNEAWPDFAELQSFAFLGGILCGALAFNSVIIFWAVRLPKHYALRIITTPLLVTLSTILVIAALDTVMSMHFATLAWIVLMNVINFLVLTVSLTVLRRAGWLRESRQLHTETTA